MSKHADALILRLAYPDELEQLEELQRRASLELPEYREQLLANPDAIHLPPAQIANGQVIVAELEGRLVGFALSSAASSTACSSSRTFGDAASATPSSTPQRTRPGAKGLR